MKPVHSVWTRGVFEDEVSIRSNRRAALAITDAQYGLALDQPPFELFARSETIDIVVGRRIGITKAVDRPWRYGLRGSRFLSKPFREP